MTWFSRLFRKEAAPVSKPKLNIHRDTFGITDTRGPEADGVYLCDYAVLDSRATSAGPPQNGRCGIIEFDFVRTFPHLSWISQRGHDDEYPAGFLYKVLTARLEPSGNFECVVVRQLANRSKTILRRFTVPEAEFPTVPGELIPGYEDIFSLKFERHDLSGAQTPEETVKIFTRGQVPFDRAPFLIELSVTAE